jgi:hypothetical protein
MGNEEKSRDVVEQPLMSTGTTEPGFEMDAGASQASMPPKIGDTVVGERGKNEEFRR